MAQQPLTSEALAFVAPPATQAGERRIVGLDGLRGLMTMFVLVSHFFGEVEHGIKAAMVGWIAVDVFFVLSGFLIGRLILQRQHHANFFAVFYARRFFRLIPIYVGLVLLFWALIRCFHPEQIDAEVQFPLWSYLSFTQTFFMVAHDDIGAHWLAPTWTLAVEEHFYLVAPALIVFTPRRWLVRVLVLLALAAVSLRTGIAHFGLVSPMAGVTMLPFRADLLISGILAAVAYSRPGLQLAGILPFLRLAPVLSLLLVLTLKFVDERAFYVWNPLLIGTGAACLIIAIALQAPEAGRYQSEKLRFFGDNGYVIYLIHLPMLGLAHALVLGTRPDIATPAQWLVTLATLPVVVITGWLITRFVEEPLMRYGRSWRWSDARR